MIAQSCSKKHRKAKQQKENNAALSVREFKCPLLCDKIEPDLPKYMTTVPGEIVRMRQQKNQK